MKLPHNIEKSYFKKGEYVGYCNGAQRIRKEGGQWRTFGPASLAGEAVYLFAPTLAELGEKLDKEKQKSIIIK